MAFSSVPLAVFTIAECLADVFFNNCIRASALFLALSASPDTSATGTRFVQEGANGIQKRRHQMA
jgi:hypothetical protein